LPLPKQTVKRDSVKDRIREWEREKEHLREIERLDELESDRDAQFEAERQQKVLEARERARDQDAVSPPRPTTQPPTLGAV
jgi:TolA-binding protein